MSPMPAASAEACDFCRASLNEQHQHLIHPETRKLDCVCDACAILFSADGQTKYKRVPRHIRHLPDFQLTDPQWNALRIPVGLVLFLRRGTGNGVLALYPSPAGPIESIVAMDHWNRIVAANPVLETMQPDVEGLLAFRVNATRDYFLLPIDGFIKLCVIVRSRWKGFAGGTDLWEQIKAFLGQLKH